MKQKIVPNLWFDKEAVEAAKFYAGVFPISKVNKVFQMHDTPSGDVDIVGFEVMGYEFMAISAGPVFKLNPAISFNVYFDTKEEVDGVWDKLIVGGKALMEIGAYPWSKRYGWLEDKFGVSWQVMLGVEAAQKVVPHFMFVGRMWGKAEEAMRFYTEVFGNSNVGEIFRHGKGQESEKEGTVAHGVFTLEGQQFSAMDSGLEHKFNFNEAISLVINCQDQKEIDYFWDKLSDVPESEQCGWIKDKYGVSWQIVPENMGELMAKNPEKTTPVMLAMKKIVITDLVKANEGSGVGN